MSSPLQVKLTFDLLTPKVVSQSRVMWATSVSILVFLGLSVLDLGPLYATDKQTDVRSASLLNAHYPRGGSIIMVIYRVVFEAEASGGNKAGGVSHPSLSLPSPPLSIPLSFQTNQWEGRSDPVR